MGKCKHPDCIYRSMSTDSCDYFFITGARRPCPAGKCEGVYKSTRRETGNSSNRRGPPLSFDETKAIEMYLAGCTDREIADTLGANRKTVCNWRNRHKLDLLYKKSESVTP